MHPLKVKSVQICKTQIARNKNTNLIMFSHCSEKKIEISFYTKKQNNMYKMLHIRLGIIS